MKTNDARGGRVGSPAAHIPTHIKKPPLHMVCSTMSSPETSHDFITSKLNITIHHRCTLFQTASIQSCSSFTRTVHRNQDCIVPMKHLLVFMSIHMSCIFIAQKKFHKQKKISNNFKTTHSKTPCKAQKHSTPQFLFILK